MPAFTTPSGPSGAKSLGDTRSSLTKQLINDGLKPRGLSDEQALAERLEWAAQPGASPSMRRKLLIEAATFIRTRYGLPPRKAEERAA
jgi:hypothetical protein